MPGDVANPKRYPISKAIADVDICIEELSGYSDEIMII